MATKQAAPKRAAKSTRTTKQTRKPTARKSSAKPKPTPTHTAAQRAKMSTAQLAKLGQRRVSLVNADGKTKRTVLRPIKSSQFGGGGTTRSPQYAAAADAASQLVCTDANGEPIGRARVGTQQVAAVGSLLKKQRKTAAATVHALIGGKSAKQSMTTARQYADGKLGRSELPDGTGERVNEFVGAFSKSIGKPSSKHKLSGKAMVAVLVALDSHPAK